MMKDSATGITMIPNRTLKNY